MVTMVISFGGKRTIIRAKNMEEMIEIIRCNCPHGKIIDIVAGEDE